MFNTVANKEQSLEEELQKTQILEFQKLKKKNERVNEIFNAAQELVFWATKYTFWKWIELQFVDRFESN